MSHIMSGAGRRIRRFTLAGGLAAAAALGTTGGVIGSGTASAIYIGGCQYNWGTPCYIVYGNVNELQTASNLYAYNFSWGTPMNGYKKPTKGAENVSVCGTMMYQEGVQSPYGWWCGREHVFSEVNNKGYTAIGSEEHYTGYNMYQMADWGEYGPCPAQGNPEC